jgi:anti-anti-sigma factor
MQLTEGEIGGFPLIVVSGDLDHSTKQSVRNAVDDILLGPYPPRGLLFDLSDCTFIDSGGLSVLFNALSHLPDDGWLGLIGVASGPSRMLTYTGFLDHEKVRFFSSVSDAAASLAREKRLGWRDEDKRAR